MERFGQKVIIEITDKQGRLIFSTSSLRIDFDIRHVDSFSRAKIDIYNMSRGTIDDILKVEAFVTIKTQLHDSVVSTLVDKWYISNGLEFTKLPNSITSLFIFNDLKRKLLEKQVKSDVKAGKIKDVMSELLRAADFGNNVEYKYFPTAILEHRPPRDEYHFDDPFNTCMKQLKDEYAFNYYTKEDGNLLLVYKPTTKNVDQAKDFVNGDTIVLNSHMMRTNPIIGPASLQIESNLDPRIVAGALLDTSKLVTAELDGDDLTVSVADDYLDIVKGYNNYAALVIQHAGSNYADKWVTTVTAYAPSKGTKMKTSQWWS